MKRTKQIEFKLKHIEENYLSAIGLTFALDRAIVEILKNTWRTASVKMKMWSWVMPVRETRGYLPLNQERKKISCPTHINI